MAETGPQHYHCQICGKVIPMGETLCSQECKQKYQSMLRRRKLMLYFMYGILAALVIVFVLSNNF
jgi:predicted nucleic acid-binding Zn ribbon protein